MQDDQDTTGDEAHQITGQKSGTHQDGKIVCDLEDSGYDHSCQDLAYIMEDTAGYADADDGKLGSALEEEHYHQAQQASGETVDQGHQIPKKEAGKNDTQKADQTHIWKIQKVQPGYDQDIRQTELDPGHAKMKWDQ